MTVGIVYTYCVYYLPISKLVELLLSLLYLCLCDLKNKHQLNNVKTEISFFFFLIYIIFFGGGTWDYLLGAGKSLDLSLDHLCSGDGLS